MLQPQWLKQSSTLVSAFACHGLWSCLWLFVALRAPGLAILEDLGVVTVADFANLVSRPQELLDFTTDAVALGYRTEAWRIADTLYKVGGQNLKPVPASSSCGAASDGRRPAFHRLHAPKLIVCACFFDAKGLPPGYDAAGLHPTQEASFLGSSSEMPG